MELKNLSIKLIALFQSLGPFQAYALILSVLFACGLGLPVPEDITLISAGIIVSTGTISLFGAVVACFVGVIGGDSILFFLGRRFGPSVFAWPIFRSIFTPERHAMAEEKIRKNAKFICFIARFMPGLRAPIYLTAGTMGVKPSTFLLADGFAALISVPVWIGLGHWFGSNIDYLLKLAKRINSIVLIAVAVIVIGIIVYRKFIRKSSNQFPQT